MANINDLLITPQSLLDLATDHCAACALMDMPLSWEYLRECADLLCSKLLSCGLTREQYSELSNQITVLYDNLYKTRGAQ